MALSEQSVRPGRFGRDPRRPLLARIRNARRGTYRASTLTGALAIVCFVCGVVISIRGDAWLWPLLIVVSSVAAFFVANRLEETGASLMALESDLEDWIEGGPPPG